MKALIDNLLIKYWDGTSTLDEEEQLKNYFNSEHVDNDHKSLVPLFLHYVRESEMTTDFVPDLSFTKDKNDAKVRYLMPKIIGIAASLLLLFTVTYQPFNIKETSYNNKYTEVENPDEALAIAIEALGFLSNKYKKGTTPVSKGLMKLEKTDVFNLNQK